MEECQACIFKVLYLQMTSMQAKEIYFKKLAANRKTLVHKMLMEFWREMLFHVRMGESNILYYCIIHIVILK